MAERDRATHRKVNVNEASREELEQVRGIGPEGARGIVEYREKHGRFRSLDDLDDVPGIDRKRLRNMRDRFEV